MEKIYFSLGFRCSSASILKRLNLKHESYPFDWLISNLKVIKLCIEDNFENFLKQDNYERKYTKTYELTESKEGFICDEHIMANMFYQPFHMQNEENTYRWNLAMNHHNIKEQKDYEYYTRCVRRLEELMQNPIKKVFIHIAPAFKFNTYEQIKSQIFTEIVNFDEFMKTQSQNISGLYFILIRNPHYNQTSPRCLYKTDEGSELWELYVPSGFIDAGENFMGDCNETIQFIENIIMQK